MYYEYSHSFDLSQCQCLVSLFWTWRTARTLHHKTGHYIEFFLIDQYWECCFYIYIFTDAHVFSPPPLQTCRLNICGSVSLTDQLSDGILWFFAAPGKLFATLKVFCSLTPDSPEGVMLKRGVQMALVNCIPAKVSVSVEHRNQVYEALVLKQAAGEGHIGLQLSAQCVSELQLRKETRCEMEVQFQLNRQSFCQMHQAIDYLPDLHNVLPDLSNCCVPVNITNQSELNNKQQIALNFILGKCEENKVAPPLLIYGPFGTGKTLCLASAAKTLALRSQNKVLICTYTNR